MASYSTDFREQMVKKMMPPNSQSTAQISREIGVPYATLYTWKNSISLEGLLCQPRILTLLNGMLKSSLPPPYLWLTPMPFPSPQD